jgi:prevent-host-death family protein
MTQHSVVDAKNKLSELIDRALSGEDVVITRHGQPVVALKALSAQPRIVTAADLDWLKSRRKGRTISKVDSVTLVSQMREGR